jgi:dienelactone hydrolase
MPQTHGSLQSSPEPNDLRVHTASLTPEVDTGVAPRSVEVRVVTPSSADGDDARPAVVLVHGFKGFMHWGFFPELAQRIAHAGLVAVAYNASHNGVSARHADPHARWDAIDDDDGFRRNTHTLELRDLALVRRWLRAGGVPGVDPARVGLFGHSRGGGIAVLSAAHEPVDALATWASIDDIDRLDEATKRHWRATGELLVPNQRTGQVHRLGLDILDEVERRDPRLDVRAAAARVLCPTLVVHGTADDAVPFSAAEALMARLPRASLMRVEGGAHSFGATHPLRSPLHPHLERVLDATVQHFVHHLTR